MELKIKKLRETSIVPEFKTEGAAGMDFYVSLQPNTSMEIPSCSVALVPLGVAIELEEGYELDIRPRSSMIKKALCIQACPSNLDFKHIIKENTYMFEKVKELVSNGFTGTIDSDYRGELHALVLNFGSSSIIINNGDRICQGIVRKVETPYTQLKLIEVDELTSTTRGNGGFGHTGIK